LRFYLNLKCRCNRCYRFEKGVLIENGILEIMCHFYKIIFL